MLNMEKLVEIYQAYYTYVPFCLGKVELENEKLQTQRMHLIHFDSTDSCCRRPQNPGSLFVDVCCSLSKRKPRDEVANLLTQESQESQSSIIFPPPPRSSAAATRASEPSPAPSADPPWLRRRCPGRLGPAAPWHGGGGKPPAWRRCIQRSSTWLVKYGRNMVKKCWIITIITAWKQRCKVKVCRFFELKKTAFLLRRSGG